MNSKRTIARNPNPPTVVEPSSIEVSVVVPVYSSGTRLIELTDRIIASLRQSVRTFEIVFVDDGSVDNSWLVAEDLQRRFPEHIVAVQLMRNFGQHNALMCGFHYSRGERVITIDDDLQQEPESIPTLLNQLEATAADLVYAAYESKRHAAGRNLGSSLVAAFYKLVFRSPIVPTSFRGMRRQLVDAILRYDLNFTYIDGLLAWNTQRIASVVVPHHARADGRSGYTFGKLLTLALNMFSNFSLLPLQLASGTGIVAATGGLLTGAYYLAESLLHNISVPGYASTVVAVLTLGGLQLLALGVIGEYVGRLHLNVNRKPQFTVRQVLRRNDDLAFVSSTESQSTAHTISLRNFA